MDFQPAIPVPPEPSSLTLLVSGLVTMAAYLLITGRWRNLLQDARSRQEQTPVLEPVPPPRAVGYRFCDYESRFAHAIGSLRAEQTDDMESHRTLAQPHLPDRTQVGRNKRRYTQRRSGDRPEERQAVRGRR
jgi:hypothetical protein